LLQEDGMPRWIFSMLCLALFGLVALPALPASANTISPFTDHTGEDHSRDDHAGEYLEGAILSLANLSRSDFSGADMTDVLLDGANLERINMTGTDLSGADLSGAFASRAQFSGANLSGADLTGADLSLAQFTGASYDAFTLFDPGFNPVAQGMNLIPEPSAASLVALGLLGLGLARRRASRTVLRT
jgi:hypothetical protein